MAKKRPLPEWYLAEPAIEPQHGFYLDSFWELSSTRRFPMGPVPWDAIVNYGHHKGLDGDIIDAFVAIVRALDGAYLGWHAKQAERDRA